MDVTLKRAADLARAAIESATKTKIETTIKVSVYEADPKAVVSAARERMTRQTADVEALLTAGFAIRRLIGEANARTDVDALLTERAMLEALQKRLSTVMAGNDDFDDVGSTDDLAERMASLKRRLDTANGFSYSETVSATLVDAAAAGAMKDRLADIRRRLSDIKDTVAGINLNTRITLSEVTVETLKKAKIV